MGARGHPEWPLPLRHSPLRLGCPRPRVEHLETGSTMPHTPGPGDLGGNKRCFVSVGGGLDGRSGRLSSCSPLPPSVRRTVRTPRESSTNSISTARNAKPSRSLTRAAWTQQEEIIRVCEGQASERARPGRPHTEIATPSLAPTGGIARGHPVVTP